MNQRGLAPILIVLFIAALVGGYLLYQKQYKAALPIIQQNNMNPTIKPTSSPEAVNVSAQKTNSSQPYLEGNHQIKGSLSYEQKLPEDNGPIYPGGWTIRYWKDSDPLALIVIPKNQTIQGTFSTLDLMSSKGLLPQLKGSKTYGDTKITIEIFNDPQFLDPSYYNKALGTDEYCNKILGVYTVDKGANNKNTTIGKLNCAINKNN